MTKSAVKPKTNAKGKKKVTLATILYPALLALVFLVIYSFIFDSKINLGGDNAGYYILGKSISSGQGYSNIHMPGNPAHNHFPPGYPAILAFFMQLSDSINFLKVINGFFLLGSSWIMFFLIKHIVGNEKIAFVGAVFMLFNMHLLSYSTIMMSEIPYMFFSLLIIYLFIKSLEQENPFLHPQLYFVILLSSFGYHIRTAGLALIGGIILYLLFRKRFAYLGAYVIGFVGLAIPWFLRGRSIGGNGYINQLFMVNPYRPEEGTLTISSLFSRFFENLGRYLGKEMPSGLFPGFKIDYQGDLETSAVFFGLLLLGIIIFGIIKLPRYRDLFIWYCVGTFGILLLWPEVWFGVRFVLPLIPIFTFFMLFGVYNIIKTMATKMEVNVSPFIPLILLLFLFPQLKALNTVSKARYEARFKNYFDIAEWVGKNTTEDAVICCRKPTLFYLFANRKTTRYASTFDQEAVLEGFADDNVTHVVIDGLGYSSTGRYLVPVVQNNPERFKTLLNYPAPDTYLLTYNSAIGYTGEWRVMENQSSLKEGKGEFVLSDRTIKGTWSNNQLQGLATTYYDNGDSMVARYEKGKLIDILYDPSIKKGE